MSTKSSGRKTLINENALLKKEVEERDKQAE